MHTIVVYVYNIYNTDKKVGVTNAFEKSLLFFTKAAFIGSKIQ